jgi:hypothetical protein
MTPEEFTGIGRAVAEEMTDALRSVNAVLEAQAGEITRLRALAENPVAALLIDAEGTLHLVQRSGARLEARLPNIGGLVAAGVAAMREEVRAEVHANVARSFEIFANAPAWSATTVYTEGQTVQAHVGRTYRVRLGVKATLGQAPGDHPEQWERIGTGGFRVLKSRPEALEPGDVFTENDARFLHDGAQTVLFVPKGAKVSDIERAVKAPYSLAQSVQAQLRDLEAGLAALRRRLDGAEAA